MSVSNSIVTKQTWHREVRRTGISRWRISSGSRDFVRQTQGQNVNYTFRQPENKKRKNMP